MQGALLSQWLDPIFFSSYVIGLGGLEENSATDRQRMMTTCQWAIFDRAPYKLKKVGNIYFTTLPFQDSRESVEARVSREHEIAMSAPGWADVEPVPAASCACFRLTQLLYGRMGIKQKAFLEA